MNEQPDLPVAWLDQLHAGAGALRDELGSTVVVLAVNHVTRQLAVCSAHRLDEAPDILAMLHNMPTFLHVVANTLPGWELPEGYHYRGPVQ